MSSKNSPKIGIVMGSKSDLNVMRQAAAELDAFGVGYEMRVVSAHRTPDDMAEYGRSAAERGLCVVIAGAGGAAHLPGMLASHSVLPVIGVPVPTASLSGMDSLLSIVQMPGGVPVATVAIGGARNAAILAMQILAISDSELRQKLLGYKEKIADESRAQNGELSRDESASFR